MIKAASGHGSPRFTCLTLLLRLERIVFQGENALVELLDEGFELENLLGVVALFMLAEASEIGFILGTVAMEEEQILLNDRLPECLFLRGFSLGGQGDGLGGIPFLTGRGEFEDGGDETVAVGGEVHAVGGPGGGLFLGAFEQFTQGGEEVEEVEAAFLGERLEGCGLPNEFLVDVLGDDWGGGMAGEKGQGGNEHDAVGSLGEFVEESAVAGEEGVTPRLLGEGFVRAVIDHDHGRFREVEVGQEVLEAFLGLAEVATGAAGDVVTGPAEIAEGDLGLGGGSREGEFDSPSVVFAFDECAADECHAVAILEREGVGGVESASRE